MSKPNLAVFLFGVFLTMHIGSAHAADWSLMYANDSNGTKIMGNISDLARAIRSGADVKVSMNYYGMDNYFPCEYVWVKGKGSETYVACQLSSHISVKNLAQGDFGFQDDTYHVYMLVDTKGRYDASRWLVGEHTSLEHTQEKSQMKWFIRR